MKTFRFFGMLLILFWGRLFSQPIINDSITLHSSTTVRIAQVNGSTYQFDDFEIGRRTAGMDVYISRSYFNFSQDLVAIPDNANISQVEVVYQTIGSGYTFKLTKPSSVTGSLQEIWTAIGNGSSLETGVSYGFGSFNSNNIKTEIQNALSSNNLVIGALSESEGTNGSNTGLIFELNVDYSYPAPLINLAARNDLNGGDGGNIGVGIYPAPASSHSSPYPFTAYVTERLNLAAYDDQIVDGKTWFFNDTECPGQKSEWIKRRADGFSTSLGNTASFTTPQLTTGDNGAQFIAYLKTSSYTTSGTLSSSETWICPVTLTGNLTVPSGVTLTLSSGVNVNFNGYYIEPTGGTFDIQNGSTVYLKSGNRFYGLFTSIQSALSAASSGSTVDVQPATHSASSNLQVNSGVTLLVQPNATINLSSGASLNVSGTLTANGTSSNQITFNFTSPTPYNGIKFNSGSGGSVTYCLIRNATYGITCTSVLPTIQDNEISNSGGGIVLNNVSSTSTRILRNNIHDNTGPGIWCNYSTVRIEDNDLIGNTLGVYCIGSSPWIYDNRIAGNNNSGIYLTNNSPARVYRYSSGNGLNHIYDNPNDIYAESQCNVSVDGNDILAIAQNEYAVRARYNVVVAAQGNYWGACDPEADDFYATEGAMIVYLPSECYPLTSSPIASGAAKTSNMIQDNGPAGESLVLDERLMAAIKLLISGIYEEAISLYKQAFKEESKRAVKQYILAQLAEGYRLAGKTDFIDFLNNEVRQNLSNDDELYATSLELENLFQISDGNYDQAIANYGTLRSRFARNEITQKNALFGLVYVHHVLLNDGASAKDYFDELKAKYPDDMLTWSAGELLKNSGGLMPAETMAEISNREVLLGNYPNPFNPVTKIKYDLPDQSSVKLVIYDMMGREVRSFTMPSQAAGLQEMVWNGTDERGKPVASGVYFCRMSIKSLQNGESFEKTARLMLLR